MPLKNGRTTAVIQQTLVGSVIPPGTIQSYGGGTVPQGWLLCDGSTASRSTYSALFAAIGVAHGEGDGTTTFHLPDLRGRFLRGADNMGTGAANRDGGGRVASNIGGSQTGIGSFQDSINKSHRHYAFSTTQDTTTNDTVQRLSSTESVGSRSQANAYGSWNFGGTATEPTVGITSLEGNSTETRPQNISVEYIIKV